MSKRKFVKVREPGCGMFSVHEWYGEVIDGKVKLKPGFNVHVFNDLKPESSYQPVPNTAAHSRKITEISEEEYNTKPKGLL